MAQDPDNGSKDDKGDVLRSSGAEQQEGYSPLLARLLDETMRDAEREKQNLDETIRQKESEARRQREEEAIARRVEIQKRVEEEQARRQALIRKAHGNNVENSETAHSVEISTETALTVSEPGPKGAPAWIPWVLVVLLGSGCGYIYMQLSGERDGLQSQLNHVSERIGEFQGKVSEALPEGSTDPAPATDVRSALGGFGTQLDSLIATGSDMKQNSATEAQKKTGLEKSLAEAETKLTGQGEALKAAQEENATLKAEIEALSAAKGKRPRTKFKPAAKKKEPAKVKVNTDIFNSNVK